MYVIMKRKSHFFASPPMRSPPPIPTGGPGLCNLPPTSSPEGEVDTGAALGQDGSYILASDRLPGTKRLSGPDRGLPFHPWPLLHGYRPRTPRSGRVYGPVWAGLRRAYIHMTETAAAADVTGVSGGCECCVCSAVFSLVGLFLVSISWGSLFFVEVLSVSLSQMPLLSRPKNQKVSVFSFSLSRTGYVSDGAFSMQGRAGTFSHSKSGPPLPAF